MAWTYEQNFNALTTADLNGQDSWSGDTDFDVIDSLSFEGAKGVRCINGNGEIARAITGVSDGTFYIAMMRPDTAGDASVQLRTDTNTNFYMRIVMESSNISIVRNGGTSNLVVGYVPNQWYLFKVTIISTSSFKVEYSVSGGAFQNPLGNLTSETTASVDTIRLACGGVGHAYWDIITPTNPNAVTPSLVSYWKLDESSGNAADSHRSNTLTNTGSMPYAAAKINNGADFVPNDSLNNASVLASTSYPRSFSMWANFDSVAIGGDQAIMTLGDNSIHYYELKLRDSDDHIVFRSNNDTDASDVDTGVVATASTWYHIVVVQNSNVSVTIYVNNVETNTAAATFIATVSDFWLGYLGRSGIHYMDGKVDEVGVWARALTAGEVTTLYNGGAGLAYPLPVSTGPTDYPLTAAQGSFTLSGQSAILRIGKSIIAAVGSFVLTGFDAAFRRTGWLNESKNSSSWDNPDKPATPAIVDSYPESNQSNVAGIYPGFPRYSAGMAFTSDHNATLTSCKFYIRRLGTVTGNIIAYLYNMTGTYGTDGRPTGSALATSDPVTASGIGTSFALVEFTFPTGQNYQMLSGSRYVIEIRHTGVDSSNCIQVGYDSTSPTFDGNACLDADDGFGGSYTTSTQDFCFYVYGIIQGYTSLNKTSSSWSNTSKS